MGWRGAKAKAAVWLTRWAWRAWCCEVLHFQPWLLDLFHFFCLVSFPFTRTISYPLSSNGKQQYKSGLLLLCFAFLCFCFFSHLLASFRRWDTSWSDKLGRTSVCAWWSHIRWWRDSCTQYCLRADIRKGRKNKEEIKKRAWTASICHPVNLENPVLHIWLNIKLKPICSCY